MAEAAKKETNEIFRKDYTPPSHLIDNVDLTFELLAEDNTLVTSVLSARPNPDSADRSGTIHLDGNPNMELREVKLNGRALKPEEYTRDGEELIIVNLPDEPFTIETTVRINPQANKTLNGLYTSGGKFTTQCESQGFRNMTFHMDRPDVMSEYTTTIIADGDKYKQLLSNGNPLSKEVRADGKTVAKWHDPHKKPAYLFALVAGDLDLLEEKFITMSGREVTLHVYVDKGDLDKAQHAMDSLKKSMKWDEERFGREYDLDLFQIVGVDDFNFGAMENKGLNIYNSSVLLANPETATDETYFTIERIIGHEYFHNWSGDRVTLRDWFELTLKEGLTVFRDQEFSSDLHNRDVRRITNASALRSVQFAEDAGPMAHPIRPPSFQTIENFYTRTVYDKGSEVIRMIYTIIGHDTFREALDEYFTRFDAQAVTTDDFVDVMQEVSGVDLSQFEKTWYNQAGTPNLTVRDEYDAATGTYKLTVKQDTPETPGQPNKEPFHIPVRMGLLGGDGQELTLNLEGNTDALTNGNVLNMTEGEQTFVFTGLKEKPVPSLLRGFSAPVKLDYPYTREDYQFLLRHDSDGFNRWDASQQLAVDVIKELVTAQQQGKSAAVDPLLISAYRELLEDSSIDNGVLNQLLTLPGETYLAELYPAGKVDVDAIYNARKQIRETLARELAPQFKARYEDSRSTENAEYQFNTKDMAERGIKNTSLSYLAEGDKANVALLERQYENANNMTDRKAALGMLVNKAGSHIRDKALADFYERYKDDTQVVNQWLSVQASADRPDVLAEVKKLMNHEAFDMKNPNKARAVVGAFAGNRKHFHNKDGSGYEFLADRVIEADGFNPQLASRLVEPLTAPHKFDSERQALMRAQLERIAEKPGLSKNTGEVVGKTLEMLDALQAKAKPAWAERATAQGQAARGRA